MQLTQLLLWSLSSYGGNNAFTSLFKRDQDFFFFNRDAANSSFLRINLGKAPSTPCLDPTQECHYPPTLWRWFSHLLPSSSVFGVILSHCLEGSDETQVMRAGRSFKAQLRHCLLGRKPADRLLFLASSCPVRAQCFHYERGSGISLNYFSKE